MKFKKQVDMKVVLKKYWARLIWSEKNRELIYSGQKATKVFGRKVVENWSMPKNGASTRINGRKMVDDVIYTSQF